MATHTPSDPAQTLANAATNAGSFGTVDKEDIQQEYTSWPVCVVDPTEEEDNVNSYTIAKDNQREDVDYLVHIASLTDQSSPRQTNDSLKDDFLDQLVNDLDGTTEEGRYEKVRRTRTIVTVGSDEVYITTLVIRVTINSTYGS